MADQYRATLVAKLKNADQIAADAQRTADEAKRAAEQYRIALRVHDEIHGEPAVEVSVTATIAPTNGVSIRHIETPPMRRTVLTLAQRIERVATDLGDTEFTSLEIDKALKADGIDLGKYAISRVSTHLNELVESGKFVRTAKPGGREPNRYRVTRAQREFAIPPRPVMHG